MIITKSLSLRDWKHKDLLKAAKISLKNIDKFQDKLKENSNNSKE